MNKKPSKKTKACKYCGKPFGIGLWTHEKYCKKNPDKNNRTVTNDTDKKIRHNQSQKKYIKNKKKQDIQTKPKIKPDIEPEPDRTPEPEPIKQEPEPEPESEPEQTPPKDDNKINIKEDYSKVEPVIIENVTSSPSKKDNSQVSATSGTLKSQPLIKSPVVGSTDTPSPPLNMDFDSEDCANMYGALFEVGGIALLNIEITLPEDKVKRRGKQIAGILKKYNLSIEYMDLMFLGVGVAGDVAFAMREAKKTKKDDDSDMKDKESVIDEARPEPESKIKGSLLSGNAEVKSP